MKNIGLFILLIMVLAACVPNNKTAEIAVQGMDVVGNIQTLMLVLLGLFLFVPAVLAGYIIIRILALWRHKTQQIDFGQWIDESYDGGTVSDGDDIGQQVQIEQQWLFSQMLSQVQEEAENHELFDPPMDWLE